ncbi:MAG: GyrI-like domain-containing protein [Chloroflexota bacterium]
MFTPVELLEQAPQPALIVHAHTEVAGLPALLGQIYGRIMGHLGVQAEQIARMPFVAYYNLDMQNLEIDAGFTVAQETPGEGDIQFVYLPGGAYAACTHFGPYDACGPAYEALTAWVAGQGREATGTAYEFYLNDPTQVTPDKIEMQILFPLKAG